VVNMITTNDFHVRTHHDWFACDTSVKHQQEKKRTYKTIKTQYVSITSTMEEIDKP
jgi:hypothetical protein